MCQDAITACTGADLIVYSDLGIVGHHIADYLGIPAVSTHLQPFGATRAFPAVGSPTWMQFGGYFNWLSHHFTDQVMWQPFRTLINAWRRDALGLSYAPFWGPYRQIKQEKRPIMYGFSPLVVPKPPDWADTQHVTGYWFLPPPPA